MEDLLHMWCISNAYSACLRIKTWVEGQNEEKIKYKHFNESV